MTRHRGCACARVQVQVQVQAHGPGAGRRKPLLPWLSLQATRADSWEGGVQGYSWRSTTSTLRVERGACTPAQPLCVGPHTGPSHRAARALTQPLCGGPCVWSLTQGSKQTRSACLRLVCACAYVCGCMNACASFWAGAGKATRAFGCEDAGCACASVYRWVGSCTMIAPLFATSHICPNLSPPRMPFATQQGRACHHPIRTRTCPYTPAVKHPQSRTHMALHA